MSRVGVIGLGNIGGAIATNLLADKHQVTAHDTDASRVLLAACYGQMGLVDEARQAWREALRINTAYSLEHRRKAIPYKNPEDFEKFIEGLRRAGLPEP